MKPSPTPVSHQPSVQTTVSDTPNIAAPTDQAIYEETQKGKLFKYDLSKSRFDAFTKTISKSAARLGCFLGETSVCHFTAAADDNPVNIIDNFSKVGFDRIKIQFAAFTTGVNSDSQQVQNNKFLVNYTINSLTNKAKKSLLQDESTFSSVDGVQVWALLWKHLVTMISHDHELTSAANNEVGHLRDHQETTPPPMTFADNKSKGSDT